MKPIKQFFGYVGQFLLIAVFAICFVVLLALNLVRYAFKGVITMVIWITVCVIVIVAIPFKCIVHSTKDTSDVMDEYF